MSVGIPAGLRATAPPRPYPDGAASPPHLAFDSGPYRVRFAATGQDLDRVLRLRFSVFNVELGEGLDRSHLTGRDEDELDRHLHHLMIVDRRFDEVVGTYRMQTADMAREHGFYSDQEFELAGLPAMLVDRAVEIGRACVARSHRNGRVLHLLWRGLAGYLAWSRKSVLFGCCSVNSQDPAVAASLDRHFAASGALHRSVRVRPRAAHRCLPPPAAAVLPAAHVPALFAAYLALGAKVCGPAAIDRAFHTIDWLVLLDTGELAPTTRRRLFR